MKFVLALMLFCLALGGCHGDGAVDNCPAQETRCSPEGDPQVCAPGADGTRWTALPMAYPCRTTEGVCCRARSPHGRVLHACVSPSLCLPDDAGADGGGL